MFHKASIHTFDDKETIDLLKKQILHSYSTEIKSRPSMHKYVTTLPNDMRNLIDKIRESDNIKKAICKQYEKCDITPIQNNDELYISHYNKDKGGDQGLFDKHYDGVFRGFVNDATVVRALVYINSNDDYVVNFIDSNISHNFKTYEFGLLDFDREYHYVDGKYDKNADIEDTRILLKLNYLVCPGCTEWYKKLLISLTLTIFYAVKKCMEYSKSPSNIFEYIIGFFCNFFRVINNISNYLTYFIILVLVILIIIGLKYIIKKIPYIAKRALRTMMMIRKK